MSGSLPCFSHISASRDIDQHKTTLSAFLHRSINTLMPSNLMTLDDEWQCGQSMAALSFSQNGPRNLSTEGALGKLPRKLTEPMRDLHPDSTARQSRATVGNQQGVFAED